VRRPHPHSKLLPTDVELPHAGAEQIARANEAGAVAKIGLVATEGHAIQVDLAPQRFAELKLQLGETVFDLPSEWS
jgi:hypothetical protein